MLGALGCGAGSHDIVAATDASHQQAGEHQPHQLEKNWKEKNP